MRRPRARLSSAFGVTVALLLILVVLPELGQQQVLGEIEVVML